jgi:hypothetical protein
MTSSHDIEAIEAQGRTPNNQGNQEARQHRFRAVSQQEQVHVADRHGHWNDEEEDGPSVANILEGVHQQGYGCVLLLANYIPSHVRKLGADWQAKTPTDLLGWIRNQSSLLPHDFSLLESGSRRNNQRLAWNHEAAHAPRRAIADANGQIQTFDVWPIQVGTLRNSKIHAAQLAFEVEAMI